MKAPLEQQFIHSFGEIAEKVVEIMKEKPTLSLPPIDFFQFGDRLPSKN